MEFIRHLVSWIFTYLLYPLAILGIFAYITIVLTKVINAAKSKLGAIRRATGAFLPFILLIFLFATNTNTLSFIDNFIGSLKLSYRFLIGVIIGVLLMEVGKFLLESDEDGAAALYNLFLSSLGTLLLWVIIGGFLESLNWVLMGLVLAAGLHVVYCGLPHS